MNASVEQPQIRIRQMKLADLPTVIAIDHQSFSLPWPESSFYFELEENNAARAWVAEMESQEGQLLICGMIVAWLIVDEIHIATIAIAPEYRSRGFGRRLMIHVLEQAVNEGANKSFLEVRRTNDAARKMYRSLGYQEDAIRPHYYQDNHEDAILMSLQKIDVNLLKSSG